VSEPTWPSAAEMRWRNRQVLAERLHWPAGALEHCEEIERQYPDWSISWSDACAWAKQEAGYFATHRQRRVWDGGGWPNLQVSGATPYQLVAAIEAVPPEEEYGPLSPLI